MGSSILGVGQMKSYQDDDNSNWFNRFLHGDNNWSKKFSDFFDFKKFTGFLNSGGSGGSNNDDDDDNNNDDNDDKNFETVKLEICGFKKPGFFVGGGKVYVPKNGNIKSFTLTHGFELHCDKTMAPNNLEINWLKNKFHLEQLVTAKCYDDGSVNEPPPSPHPGPTLDVYYGKGYGRYNGQCGALAEWVMDDNGEPGKADQIVALRITYGTGVFEINPGELGVTDTSRSGTWKNPGGINDNSLWLDLKTGNHQFVPHPASHPNPPTQTTPCPRVPTP